MNCTGETGGAAGFVLLRTSPSGPHHHFFSRYYDPVIGRFLAIDPVEFTPDRPDMFNRYAYVGNDPLNMVDPWGLYECTTNGNDIVCEGTIDEFEAIMTSDEMEGYTVTGVSANVGYEAPGVVQLEDVGDVWSTNSAFGIKGPEHVYGTRHGDVSDRAVGRNGSSGKRSGDEQSGVPASVWRNMIPASNDHVGNIWVPAGSSYDDFADDFDKTGMSGIYMPWLNDCHTSMMRSARNVGGVVSFNEKYDGRIGAVN